MDSGFLQPGETLEDDYDTLAPLLPEELIGIMDQLLCHEMAWHTGYPLSQTLFTSVYIDKLLWPETRILEKVQFYRGDIPDEQRPGPLLQVLRAYCLALIKGCDYVIAKIAGRDYFEEEDFCTHTYNRVLLVIPPRPIVELEFKDALEKLQQITTDCEEATRFTTLPQDPLEYQSFLWYFASRSPQPLAYARSYLATLLFHPDVLQSPISLPLADIRTLVFPSSPVLDPSNWAYSPPRNPMLPKPPRLQLAMLIDEFVDRSGSPYMDLWVALGQNRCRLRRMLTHVIAAWDMLQGDAAAVDEDINAAATELQIADHVLTFSLSTWTYHKKLWMIEKIILLGFEQDIYLPDEFAELLKKVEAHYVARASELFQSRRLRDAQDVDDATPYIDSLLAEVEGIASLSLALARFNIVLLYLGLLPMPKRPFGTEELRYELRMKPFLSLQPPEVPPFADFKEHTQPYGAYSSPVDAFKADLLDAKSELWTEIDSSLKGAKEAFAEYKKLGARAAKTEGVEKAWAKDVQSVLASCIALGVAVAGVKDAVMKAGEGGGVGVKIEVPESGAGKRYAEGWVVVKVAKE
ncbi:hypothetical protein SNOG_01695 [Parastagonospora nodorum SN15]|uniref:Uncharacterized protein n=1 Tax=Phaeosphaeria nodorum (strain SN15 / ATCC MYA-4574 / FGSC 10173) TaxID=321614 RepID=Q0V2R9_PHANO|nr:hypothetical protein SNOG_01695 [Parastagonospora nodorum SN15]EAT91344.2 hypothetical protein SNOG_01695 [Parastagonospora nodorum SN15]